MIVVAQWRKLMRHPVAEARPPESPAP